MVASFQQALKNNSKDSFKHSSEILSEITHLLVNWAALGACPVLGLPSAFFFSFFFRLVHLAQISGIIAVNAGLLKHPVERCNPTEAK